MRSRRRASAIFHAARSHGSIADACCSPTYRTPSAPERNIQKTREGISAEPMSSIRSCRATNICVAAVAYHANNVLRLDKMRTHMFLYYAYGTSTHSAYCYAPERRGYLRPRRASNAARRSTACTTSGPPARRAPCRHAVAPFACRRAMLTPTPPAALPPRFRRRHADPVATRPATPPTMSGAVCRPPRRHFPCYLCQAFSFQLAYIAAATASLSFPSLPLYIYMPAFEHIATPFFSFLLLLLFLFFLLSSFSSRARTPSRLTTDRAAAAHAMPVDQMCPMRGAPTIRAIRCADALPVLTDICPPLSHARQQIPSSFCRATFAAPSASDSRPPRCLRRIADDAATPHADDCRPADAD